MTELDHGRSTERDRLMTLTALNGALTGLHSAVEVGSVASAVPTRIVDMGYERAMFSWTRDDRWFPRSACIARAPELADVYLAAGGPPAAHARTNLECAIIRSGTPTLVVDALENPAVYRPLHGVCAAPRYAVVPVTARGQVCALIHVAQNRHTGTTDAFDLAVMCAFGQAVGRQLEIASGAGRARPRRDLDLTSREREVWRLVAHGLTNQQIADQLFVSVETTKSHVKSILRKLGVSNRAMAGAAFHRAGHAGTN